MLEWLRVDVDTYYETGEQVVRYSHTPEEFVAELRARGECVYVTKGACSGCMYTPERMQPLTRDMVDKKMKDEFAPLHRFPECMCGAVAHYYRRTDVPDFLCCYAFYYQFVHRNQYLLAAKEAGLVTFYDTSSLLTLSESGLHLTLPDWMR